MIDQLLHVCIYLSIPSPYFLLTVTSHGHVQHLAILHSIQVSASARVKHHKQDTKALYTDFSPQRLHVHHVPRAWRIVLVDQRNHGHSAELPGFDPPHTMGTAAQDLTDLIQQKYAGQPISVIAGHSLGGKTTLEFLKQTARLASSSHVPQQVCIRHFHKPNTLTHTLE